jgi:DNA-nicking Smr family endonuclease
VKKKKLVTNIDKEDWIAFTKRPGKLHNKDIDILNNNNNNKICKLDLHGFSLTEANLKVKKFVLESFKDGFKKILIITGKGLRSKVYKDPYRSEKMNVLKHSVPNYIKQDKDLINIIKDMSKAELKDGGEGAFYIFLK